MRLRTLVIVGLSILVAVVLQTTLFTRLVLFTPDLVMLVVILLALTRLRPELVLGFAFLSGLIVDLLGSSLLGLRAVVFTAVAFIALRTRERAEIGRLATALWAGFMTLIGVFLLLVLGTIFGQNSLLGEGVLGSLISVPLSNMVLAAMLAPVFVRLVDQDAAAFRYS